MVRLVVQMSQFKNSSNDVWKYGLSAAIIVISLTGVMYGTYLVAYILGNPIEKALGGFFVFLLAVNALFNSAGCYYYLKSFEAANVEPKKLKRFPAVAVVVPARNENTETVKQTLSALFKLDYPKEKLNYYLLDNSTKPDKKIEEYCRKHGVAYEYVENPVKLKSYALNHLFPKLKEEYVALFDADDVLWNGQFLKENLGFLEEDKTLASVQTKKEYAQGSLFANTVNAYYSFFYNFVQPVRNNDKSGMFCGSCGIVRRSIVKAVGGFPHSPTEDTAFSFEADLKGYGGAFNSKNYAFGEPIESFATFLAQQWRYTIGNSWLITSYLKNVVTIPFHKQLHYITQVFSFMYLSYLFIFYALLTLSFVVLNLSTTFFYNALIPEMANFLALTYLIAIILMIVAGAKLYYGSYKLGLMVLFVNFAVAITRARAIIVAILGLPTRFVMTRQNPNTLKVSEALWLTLPETVLTLMLTFFAIVSFIRLDLIASFWLFWYAWLFSSAFIFAWSTDVKKKNAEKERTAA